MIPQTETDAAFDPNADRLREECGVFGIYGHADAAALTALGLHALQHRGQEAAGIVSFDGKRFHSERRLGLVGDAFSEASVIDKLQGRQAIGHVRYSTTGETILRNVQPLFAELHGGGFHLKSKPRAGTEVTITLPAERVMDALPALPEPRVRAA